MDKILDDNYLLIQGWMRKQLNLKGNELLVYAIIYGFTQDGESEFNGSRSYIAEWIGTTLPTVDKSLSSLIEKGLIEKSQLISNNITINRYKINLGVVKNLYRGCKEILQGGCKEILHNNNNINNNNNNIKENNTKEKKTAYGEYHNVLLTDDQFAKLEKEYGPKNTADIIKFLDEYIQEKGYKSKEHYLAIKRWVNNAVNDRRKKQLNSGVLIQREYTQEDFDGVFDAFRTFKV